MNYTQTFEEFSRGLGPTDLFLYAGVGLVVWVLFKERLSPVQSLLVGLFDQVKNVFSAHKPSLKVHVPQVLAQTTENNDEGELFFKLIVSWKQTRDLALRCKCSKAVEVADSMFPYLSPNVCSKENNNAQF